METEDGTKQHFDSSPVVGVQCLGDEEVSLLVEREEEDVSLLIERVRERGAWGRRLLWFSK